MTPAQFLSRIKRGDVPPVALLLGSESYERRRCREAVSGARPDQETTQYDLSEVDLSQVIDDARSLSLFVSERLIIATSAEGGAPAGR